MDNIVASLSQLIVSGKIEEAVELSAQIAKKDGYPEFTNQILMPVLNSIGGNYLEGDTVSLSTGYLAAKYAEKVMLKAYENHDFSNVNSIKGIAVIGNIENDFHSLGRRIVSTFLKASGWDIVDLGNDVSPKTFVDKAIENKASIIGVSAMMYATAINIQEVRKEINLRNLKGKIQLAVGGAVFIVKPELIELVGADGTATNAFQAPELFENLLLKSHKACK